MPGILLIGAATVAVAMWAACRVAGLADERIDEG